jgi:hypothetical protein
MGPSRRASAKTRSASYSPLLPSLARAYHSLVPHDRVTAALLRLRVLVARSIRTHGRDILVRVRGQERAPAAARVRYMTRTSRCRVHRSRSADTAHAHIVSYKASQARRALASSYSSDARLQPPNSLRTSATTAQATVALSGACEGSCGITDCKVVCLGAGLAAVDIDAFGVV